ncbi:hypothetical protein HW555_005808 [Spodoptera exigua]|uniref:Integrin beta n=1 Tax=Spodoptera exigua TaxID=7107 RepID=A0A835L455_SPOEX|nr:hypothetical protein HW555_005808 [Spodoptera exigua]
MLSIGLTATMSSKCLLIYFLTFSLQFYLSFASDICQQKTCQECIRDPHVCVWCAMNNFNGTRRCMPRDSYTNDWCPESLQNPINVVTEAESKEFSSSSDNVIQIKPQRYKLNLRPGVPESFKFSFQGAKDFPVDLYFLLDASTTMANIRDMTAKHSEKIYLSIKEMTKNVHLGFGTFIDKRVLPFTNNTFDTELTYSFRHRMKLADDFNKFKDVVSKTPSGLNRDSQEGGLDALAQDHIHTAGDGKTAGLFKPYDGKCYTENVTYTKELEMDYPSVGMINKLATESDIIVIFVVDSRVKDVYQGLSKAISGSRLTEFNRIGKGTNDEMIVHVLKDIYTKISKKIKLKTKVKSGRKKDLSISFDPDCTTNLNIKECDVEIGKESHLVGTVRYDGTEDVTLDIIVEGIGEKLTLDIESIKSCECEKNVELRADYCHGEARFCGICHCSDKRYGDRCACVKSERNIYNDNSTCIAAGSKDICSRHGICNCGSCECLDRYEGEFCECNVDSCPRSAKSGEVCNGKLHGKCNCGKCKCAPNWSGDACDCYDSDVYCKGSDGSICHNRGECVCGACQCSQIAEWDARNSQDPYCQVSPCTDCHDLQCRKLSNCAKGRRIGKDECNNDRIKITVVDKLSDDLDFMDAWNLCSNIKVEDNCNTSFYYRYNDTDYSIEVIIARNKDCAPNYFMGIGTLVAWKLLTDAKDRHEYLQFLQQNKLDASGPSTNPLYESPTTTFNNPAFRKKSIDHK